MAKMTLETFKKTFLNNKLIPYLKKKSLYNKTGIHKKAMEMLNNFLDEYYMCLASFPAEELNKKFFEVFLQALIAVLNEPNSLINVLNEECFLVAVNRLLKMDVDKYVMTVYLNKIDRRSQIEETNIRRLDSLARILSLPADDSICTCIAFNQGKLLVSANVSHENSQRDIVDKLIKRVKALKSFIQNIKNHYELTQDETFFFELLWDKSEAFYQEYIKPVGHGLETNRIVLDLCKFAHAIILDDTTFSESVRQFWDRGNLNLTVLLPTQEDTGEFMLMSAVSSTAFENGQPLIAFHNHHLNQPAPDFLEVKYYHAEQLLAYYLFNIKRNDSNYNVQNELTLGISKLCCQDCYTAIKQSELPIQIRGTHDQSYHNTVRLLDKHVESVFQTPVRNQARGGLTNAINSEPRKAIDRTELSMTIDIGFISTIGDYSPPQSPVHSPYSSSKQRLFSSMNNDSEEEKEKINYKFPRLSGSLDK